MRDMRLSVFIKACLEPLPRAALVDTAYNSAMRQARQRAWREAKRTTLAYGCACDLALWFDHRPIKGLEALHEHLGGNEKRANLVNERRRLTALQILTPAPDKGAVKWKRFAAKDRYLPISHEQIEAAIAADEAWLAAHPTTKEPRRPRRKKERAD
ncbi:hypothetical protein [Mesorhizobium sp. M2C.T.Ca.TU.002.02.1.1]|uniref:hypothetical protein n=1 Tax=Mesorhizobium sp. M2C.T.Ca.TU.002.02.1.1 TaxID=2496788 RepID=UPI000FCC0650|nr:hypothetical protein [Mesorhizobium sp. M2C.T.Ca.TU.002.02.1.1]RUU59941.1 hypothetical protein EOD07_05615 [Mesorhizobium sp. M2C.T.Ca.TU.002.02.1.1]RUU63593.1 hypothetical protein EOD04_22540 [Mesorhizobium sp. M2C.T.Ca.TU.009.01.2.1]